MGSPPRPALHLSCAAEGDYVFHSAAMLDSALAHRGQLDLHVHFLHGPRLPDSHARMLTDWIAGHPGAYIHFHPVADDLLQDLPSSERFTAAMWHRTFLPELLPDVSRALYLDADTIVLDDLEPLTRIDLADAYLGATTNVLMPHHRHRPRELGLAGADSYFNSGVLLLNLEQMRRDDAAERVRALARERGDELEWPDQDALNLVLGERRVPLHPRWNAMNSLMTFAFAADVFDADTLAEARADPAIRHFEGPGENKPWNYLCLQSNREAYAHHRARTPWPDWHMEQRTVPNAARKAKRRLRRRLRPTA